MRKSCLFAFTVILHFVSYFSFGQNIFPDSANVGIGTLSPIEKLDVRGNVLWDGFNSGNPRALKIGYSGGHYGGIGYNVDFTGTTGIFNRPIADQSAYLEFTYGGFRFFGNANNNSAQGVNLNGSGNNLNLLATITRTGNFGIGVEEPTHKLTLDGNIKINGQSKGVLIEYATLSETINGATTILGNNVIAGIGNNTVKRFYSSNDPGSYLSLNYQQGITFHTGINSSLNTEVSSFNNEVMRIAQSGNVGIGTTDPKGYKLAVNGKIRAHEIKVEAANWPDYVFAKTYSLQSLQETEKYIKDKGHLPGIPSAVEVKANGIDLGEMNAKLLRKIEELTLYMIEQNKRLNEQEKFFKEQISAQQIELEKLKKR